MNSLSRAPDLVAESITPELSVVRIIAIWFLLRLTQRRNSSSLFHVYVTVGAHGILHFVVALFAVISKGGDIEALVALERMRRKALVHDLICGFKIGWRPLIPRIGRMLNRRGILDEVGCTQPRFGLVLRIESLQTTPRRHCLRVLPEMRKVHLAEKLILLLARILIARPDAIQLIGEPHLIYEVLGVPISGQDVQNGTIARQHEKLDVMRSGAVRRLHGIAEIVVASRFATIRLISNIFRSADEIVFEGGVGWFLRERHGSQAIAGTSRGAGHAAQHVDPEDHFALLAGGLLDLSERLVPAQRRRHRGDAVVRGLSAQVSGLP